MHRHMIPTRLFRSDLLLARAGPTVASVVAKPAPVTTEVWFQEIAAIDRMLMAQKVSFKSTVTRKNSCADRVEIRLLRVGGYEIRCRDLKGC